MLKMGVQNTVQPEEEERREQLSNVITTVQLFKQFHAAETHCIILENTMQFLCQYGSICVNIGHQTEALITYLNCTRVKRKGTDVKTGKLGLKREKKETSADSKERWAEDPWLKLVEQEG